MSASNLKWLFTVCSVVTASVIYGLLAISLIADNFNPAIIGPLLGFTFGAGLVIFTVWRAPVEILDTYTSRAMPTNRQEFLLWLWWFFALCSASFMLWIAGGAAVVGALVGIFALLGLDPATGGPVLAVTAFVWFGGAVWISARGLPIAVQGD